MTIFVESQVLNVLKRRMDAFHTPDLLKLQKYPFFVLMDYGLFMTGGRNADIISGCPKLGMCTTVTEEFKMLNGSEYPVAFTERKRMLGDHIRGEAFIVSLPTLMRIDQVYSNGTKVQRKPVMVELGEQEARKPNPFVCRALMYVGLDHAWTPDRMTSANCFWENRVKIYEW